LERGIKTLTKIALTKLVFNPCEFFFKNMEHVMVKRDEYNIRKTYEPIKNKQTNG